jgi:hypothetical protein
MAAAPAPSSKKAKAASPAPAAAPATKSFSAFVLSKHKYAVGDAVRVRGGDVADPAGPQFIAQITKIEAKPGDNRNVMLTVNWYYRPEVRPSVSACVCVLVRVCGRRVSPCLWLSEPWRAAQEIEGGRRPWHGQDEVLKSDHADRVPVQSVNGPCKVLTFEQYQALDTDSGGTAAAAAAAAATAAAAPEELILYWREDYDARRKSIKVGRIPHHVPRATPWLMGRAGGQTKLPVFCVCKQPQNPDRMMILCDACEDWFHST